MFEKCRTRFGNFIVVSDGQCAVGRNFGEDEVPELETEQELNIVRFQRDGQHPRRFLENAYDEAIQEISFLEKEASVLEKKAQRARQLETNLRKIHNIVVILWSLLGLYMGLVIAVGEVLQTHGPTTSILGTIGASFMYILSGVLGCIAFTFVGWYQNQTFVSYTQGKAREYTSRIEEIQAEIEELKADASRLADKAWT